MNKDLLFRVFSNESAAKRAGVIAREITAKAWLESNKYIDQLDKPSIKKKVGAKSLIQMRPVFTAGAIDGPDYDGLFLCLLPGKKLWFSFTICFAEDGQWTSLGQKTPFYHKSLSGKSWIFVVGKYKLAIHKH